MPWSYFKTAQIIYLIIYVIICDFIKDATNSSALNHMITNKQWIRKGMEAAVV